METISKTAGFPVKPAVFGFFGKLFGTQKRQFGKKQEKN